MGLRASLCIAALLATGLTPCAAPPPEGVPDDAPLLHAVRTDVHRMPRANRGPEAYSAWFADRGGDTVYFGLSPFWSLWWERDGDSSADLEQPGDLLIGRFDLATERFLAPLSLRREPGATSVWDVLVHSSGRVCFTTYFDAMGCVDPETGDVERFETAGPGLNEIWEGPQGDLYVTRYSSAPGGDPFRSHGAVVVISPRGSVLREHVLANPPGGLTAPKSVAVDPGSGEIWLNTDTFLRDGRTLHETIRLAPDGKVLSRGLEPHLHFVSFAPDGTGYFAEVEHDVLWLRIARGGEDLARLPLGPIVALDFVQDVKHAPGGETLLALWSGAVYVVDDERGWRARAFKLRAPESCRPPQGRSIFYSAFLRGERICATLFCGASVACAPVEDPGIDDLAEHQDRERRADDAETRGGQRQGQLRAHVVHQVAAREHARQDRGVGDR